MAGRSKDPERIGALLARLLAVLEANRYTLPRELLGRIDAISVKGADPDWQVSEMTQIMDEWVRRQ